MKMSGTTNQTGKAGGDSDRSNVKIHDTDSSASNLEVNADMSTSDDDEFVSPRTLVSEAKSSEEEITVSNAKETLLKDKTPLSENTRKLLSRHSSPAKSLALTHRAAKNAPSRSSLGSGNDVLARAREAIEGRKKSREAAKAKVSADMAYLIGGGMSLSASHSSSSLKDDTQVKEEGEDVVPTSHATSPPKDDAKVKEVGDQAVESVVEKSTQNDEAANVGQKTPAKVNSARAKAKARLNATMAFLAANSSGKTNASTSHATSSLKDDSTSNEEGKNATKSELDNGKQKDKTESVDHTLVEESVVKVGKDDEESPPIAQSPRETQAAERLEQERLATEAAKQAELDRIEKERIEQERILAKQRQKEEEARQLADEQAEDERLEQERLAKQEAATQAELEKLEDDRIKREIEEAMRRYEVESPNNEAPQPSTSFDPIANNSSSCSTNTAPIMDMPSETSDASSLGQVDRYLYQGEKNDLHQDDDLHRDYSDDDVFEAVTNSYNENESQASNIIEAPNDNDTEPSLSPGPVWKQAAEEAAFATALANDFIPRDTTAIDAVDPSPSIRLNRTNLTSKKSSLEAGQREALPEEPSDSNYEYNEEDRDVWLDESEERDEAVGLSEWKGFKWNRMLYMLLFGIQAGLLPSLYAQLTCHFISVDAAVGRDGVEFGLYFGLQKFTPIDSAFQGYSYCQSYDSEYNYNPPMIPRVAGVAATIFGTIPLIVIGVYLRFSMTHRILWIGSMFMLYMGFVCQISTLSIFLLDLCRDGIDCSMGPGAWTSGISSIAWFILSIEMKLNSPLYQPVKSSEGVVVIEKDRPFISRIKKVRQRFNGKTKVPSLSRTARRVQKERIEKGETEMSRYRAPGIV